MLASTIKETFLSLHDFFVGRKWKKVKKATPQWWKKRNQRAFENEGQFDQKLKFSFLSNLSHELRRLIDFVD